MPLKPAFLKETAVLKSKHFCISHKMNILHYPQNESNGEGFAVLIIAFVIAPG